MHPPPPPHPPFDTPPAGIGAYSFAPIFQEGCISPPSAAHLSCEFWAATPFTLRLCAAAGPMPQHSCSTLGGGLVVE